MKPRWLAFAILFFLLGWFLPLNQACGQDEFRTWRDSTGEFEVEAKFVKLEDGMVHIEKKDGRVIQVAMTRLSVRDVEYVGRMQAGNLRPNAGRESTLAVNTVDAELIDVDTNMGWQMQAQPRPLEDALPPQSLSMEYWKEDDQHQSIFFAQVAVVRNENSNTWLVFDARGGHFRANDGVDFVRGAGFDMHNHQLVGQFRNTPVSEYVNVINDDMTRMLFVMNDPQGGPWAYSVAMYEMNEGRARKTHVLDITPDDFAFSRRKFPLMQFADDDHFIVTTSMDARLVTGCVRISDGVLLWTVPHDNARWPLVTPDKSTVILRVGGGLAAFDLATGQQRGWIEHNSESLGTLSLSPDGIRLIEATPQVVTVYDFETGAMLKHFGVLSSFSAYDADRHKLGVEWISNDRFAIVSREEVDSKLRYLTVVDLSLQTPLCHYRFEQQKTYGGVDRSGRLRYLVDDEAPNLTWHTISLPHDEIADEIDSNLQDLVRIDNSTPVTISCRWLASLSQYFSAPGTHEKYKVTEERDIGPDVVEILEAKFQRRGYKLSSNSDFSIQSRARTGGGGSQLAAARRRKRPAGFDNATVMSQVPPDARITGYGYSSSIGLGDLKYDGLTMWIPQTLQLEPKRDFFGPDDEIRFKSAEEILLSTVESMDIPSSFARPRVIPTYMVRGKQIKRFKDEWIERDE
ncbi:MAG: SHD1 domain-containing protein [Pirellulaceae bacterium]